MHPRTATRTLIGAAALGLSVTVIPAANAAAPAHATPAVHKLATTTLYYDDSQAAEFKDAVVAYLKSHQDINAVFSPFPAVIAGLAPQLSTAGIKDVKLITGGEVDIYNPLKSGVVTAAVYRQDPEWVYTVFDAFARIFVGDSTAPDEQTASNTLMWVVDKSTVPDEASKDIYFPLVTDFEQQFYKLWKLQ